MSKTVITYLGNITAKRVTIEADCTVREEGGLVHIDGGQAGGVIIPTNRLHAIVYDAKEEEDELRNERY